jgi:hypothetical protein
MVVMAVAAVVRKLARCGMTAVLALACMGCSSSLVLLYSGVPEPP